MYKSEVGIRLVSVPNPAILAVAFVTLRGIVVPITSEDAALRRDQYPNETVATMATATAMKLVEERRVEIGDLRVLDIDV